MEGVAEGDMTGQSNRPPLSHSRNDSSSDSGSAPQAEPQEQQQPLPESRPEAHPRPQPQQPPPPSQPQPRTQRPPAAPRSKSSKHLVGGGSSTTRLHARVPSSKALHKAAHHHHHLASNLHHVASTSSAKLPSQPSQAESRSQSQAQSQSQSQSHAQPPISPKSPNHAHRRSTSGDTRLPRSGNASSTATLVRKNASASSLKRNRSQTEVVATKQRPTAHLKRANSNPAATDRLRQLNAAKKTGVRFEIGSPDAQDDEWVDAAASTIDAHKDALLRRHIDDDVDVDVDVDEKRQDSRSRKAKEASKLDDASPEKTAKPRGTNPSGPPPRPAEPPKLKPLPRTASSASTASTSAAHLRTSSSTTRLLLPRTPPSGAPPKMSTETASGMHHVQPSSSSGSSASQQQQQQQQQQNQPQNPRQHTGESSDASSDRDAMTSRFITGGSHESASATPAPGSFYTTSSSRPSSSRHPDDHDIASAYNTPATGLSHMRRPQSSSAETAASPDDDDDDDDDSSTAIASSRTNGTTNGTKNGVKNGNVHGSHPRRTRMPPAPPAELSRTQQKLNLERASSSLDRSNRQHQGPAASPLLGAGGFGMHDPRIGKLMEKTGMEYYVVRRYQNPVTRSLDRLTDRLGGDKNWRIPAAAVPAATVSAAAIPAPAGATTTATTLPSGRPRTPGEGISRTSAGLSQSFRERDIRRDVLHQSMAAATAAAATHAAVATSRDQQRLSGTSLVDGEGGSGSGSGGAESESTAALLRNLWDKNLYLGSSQD